jgi:putative DNA primase/helicase
MVNVDADLSGDILSRHTGKLKKLTGNDEFPAEFKFRPPFMFRNYAKLIFSCNEIPQTDDTTDAFFRRLIIINFTTQFFGDKEDIHLLEKLTTKEELSGLFQVLVNRLPRVLENGIRKATNENLASTYEKYIKSSNPVKYFDEKVITKTDNEADKILKEQLYESYLWFCRVVGTASESSQSFSRKFGKGGLGYQYKKGSEDGKKGWYWYGIKLAEWVLVKSMDKAQQTFEELELSDETKEALR